MIPGHKQFIEAVHAKHKVCVRFYSAADSGVVDRVCAPLDYGTGGKFKDGLNRYLFWDYTSNAEPRVLGLVPQQITDLRVLGEAFDPGQLATGIPHWNVLRDWGSPQPAQPRAAGPTDVKP
jgi:hypothetical protein